jgi:hypothetical protein
MLILILICCKRKTLLFRWNGGAYPWLSEKKFGCRLELFLFSLILPLKLAPFFCKACILWNTPNFLWIQKVWSRSLPSEWRNGTYIDSKFLMRTEILYMHKHTCYRWSSNHPKSSVHMQELVLVDRRTEFPVIHKKRKEQNSPSKRIPAREQKS